MAILCAIVSVFLTGAWVVVCAGGAICSILGLALAARWRRLWKHMSLWLGLILNGAGIVIPIALDLGW